MFSPPRPRTVRSRISSSGGGAGVLEADEDAVLVAALAVLPGAGAAQGGLQRACDGLDGDAQVGGLGAVDADHLLRHAGLLGDADVGDTLDILEDTGGLGGERVEDGQVEAADLDGQAVLAADESLEHALALGGAGADGHAGDAAFQFDADGLGDLGVGAVALVQGDEGELDLALGGVVGVVGRGADADDRALGLGHHRETDRLHQPGLLVDQVQAGADLHLAGDADLALVAGGEELGADRGDEQG